MASISFSLVVSDRTILEELKTDGALTGAVESGGARFGGISEVPPPSQANFDVAGAIHQAYQLLAVISTGGGAIQFGDWLLGKIAAARSKAKFASMMIKHGAVTSVVSTEQTDEENRTALDRVFGPG